MAISAQISEVAGQSVKNLKRDIERYGHLRALVLYTFLLQLRPVLTVIQKHVVDPNHHEPDKASQSARAIRDSYTSVFTTVGVAGAIIAQVAVSALMSYYDIADVSFLVQLALILGALAGVLSVYFACIIQTKLSGLPGGTEIKEWLTTPERSLGILRTCFISEGQDIAQADEVRMPSFGSALMLTMPTLLLNISLWSILVGDGIYIGQLYTLHPSQSLSQSQSFATLITYVVLGGVLLIIGTGPGISKMLEGTNAAHQDRQERVRSLNVGVHGKGSEASAGLPLTMPTSSTLAKHDSRNASDPRDSAKDSSRSGTVSQVAQQKAASTNKDSEALVAALQLSIAAHQASIKAEEALLRSLSSS